MWTFDRYWRWIEQQKEWVRPTPPPAVAADGEIVRAATRAAMAVTKPPVRRAAPAKSSVTPAEGQAEISIDEPMDLEELAELARRIERRTP
jgi:hypothetical protein